MPQNSELLQVFEGTENSNKGPVFLTMSKKKKIQSKQIFHHFPSQFLTAVNYAKHISEAAKVAINCACFLKVQFNFPNSVYILVKHNLI